MTHNPKVLYIQISDLHHVTIPLLITINSVIISFLWMPKYNPCIFFTGIRRWSALHCYAFKHILRHQERYLTPLSKTQQQLKYQSHWNIRNIQKYWIKACEVKPSISPSMRLSHQMYSWNHNPTFVHSQPQRAKTCKNIFLKHLLNLFRPSTFQSQLGFFVEKKKDSNLILTIEDFTKLS